METRIIVNMQFATRIDGRHTKPNRCRQRTIQCQATDTIFKPKLLLGGIPVHIVTILNIIFFGHKYTSCSHTANLVLHIYTHVDEFTNRSSFLNNPKYFFPCWVFCEKNMCHFVRVKLHSTIE